MPSHRRSLAVACVLIALHATGMPAVANAAGSSRYSIKVWANDEGLPQNSALSLVQTRDGYLWVGTFKGLVRFDGFDFKNLTPELNDPVVHLFEDSRRTLWIGTENSGTMTFKDGHLSRPPELAAGGFERRLRAACEDAEGAVWLYYENGDLWRCRPGRPPRAFVPPREEGTRTMIREVNGPVWIGTSRHQYEIGPVADNGSFELPVAQDISLAPLDILAASASGGYWRLANGRVQRVVGGSERNVAGQPWWPYNVSSACEDREGNLVLGTKGAGVFIISPEGKVSSISTNNSDLSASTVLCVVVDREGTLWVGTDGGGLNRVRRNTFHLLESTRNWVVKSVAQDAAGSLWIGGWYNNGLGYWTNGVMFRLGPEPPIQSVFVDRERGVWVGAAKAESGLLQLRDQGFQVLNPAGLIQSKVQAIFQDRNGDMWFGTENGLVRSTAGEWKLFSGSDGLSSTNITSIADGANGTVWIGTQRGGVNRLHDGKITALRKAGGAPSDDIAGLIVDEQGVLWATTPAGLGRYEAGRWTRYDTNTGLVSDSLGYIVDDREGNLWIGSDLGILRLPKAALNEFANGTRKSVPCRAYGKADGLPTRECTSGSQPGPWVGMDRTIWFPTSKGVAELNLAQFQPNTNPPPVLIQGVLVDDVPRKESRDSSGTAEIVVKPGDDRLAIHYASLNLGAPERAHFRYRLEGYDKTWRDAGGETRVASYSRLSPWLSPAHYTFHVMAANEDGVWNETGATLAVVVQPPVMKTWWFLALTAVIVSGLIAAVARYLSTQKLQRQLAVLRQQEALERERARIARDIHDQVGASLTQVALLGELVETDKESPQEVQGHAQQICQTARETTRALDEIVWTVNPQNDTLEGLVNYICKYAQDYLAVAGLRYRFDVPAELPARTIAPDVRHNVFLASKEAVTNVVRHAKATAAWVRLKLDHDSFTIEIEDNGRGVAGLDLSAPQTRNGLKNMRKRMEDVGGSFSIGPGSEGGALVRLTVPLQTRNPKPETRN